VSVVHPTTKKNKVLQSGKKREKIIERQKWGKKGHILEKYGVEENRGDLDGYSGGGGSKGLSS